MATSRDLPAHLLSWLQGLSLSYALRSIRRDFCNGYLVAEILSKYYPADVSMNAFGNYGSQEKKKSNWLVLQKLFQRGKIPISQKLAQNVLNAEEGAAVKLLEVLRAYLEQEGLRDDSGGSVDSGEAATQLAEEGQPMTSMGAASQGHAPFQPQSLTWLIAEQHGAAAGHTAGPAVEAIQPVVPCAMQAAHYEAGTSASSGSSARIAAQSEVEHDQASPAILVVAEVANPAQLLGHSMAPPNHSFLPAGPVDLQEFSLPYDAAAATAPWSHQQIACPVPEWAMVPVAAAEAAASPHFAAPLDSGFPGSEPECQPAGLGQGCEWHYLQQVCTGIQPLQQPHEIGTFLAMQQLDPAADVAWPEAYICPQLDVAPYTAVPPDDLHPASASRLPLDPPLPPPSHQQQHESGAPVHLPGRATSKKAAASPNAQQRKVQQQQQGGGPGQGLAQALAESAGGGQACLGGPIAMLAVAVPRATSPQPPSAAAPGELAATQALPLPRIEYDRRPRAVDFKPYSHKDFKLMDFDVKQAKRYWELGRLGPDYHEDALWRQKWEKLERQKEFGRAARVANQQKAAEHPTGTPPRPNRKKKAPSSREKAVEFAKGLPKPEPPKPSRAASAQVAEQLSKLQMKRVSAKDKSGLAEMIRTELGKME